MATRTAQGRVSWRARRRQDTNFAGELSELFIDELSSALKANLKSIDHVEV